MMETIVRTSINALFKLFILLGPGIGLALIIGWASKRMVRAAMRIFPARAYLILFGWPGAIVHELSHAGIALVFGYKIDKVCLFRIDPESKRIGYVRLKHNPKSILQKVGKLFVGMAPLFGCGAVILIACYLLTPSLLPDIPRHMDTSATGLLNTFYHGGHVLISGLSAADLYRHPQFYAFLYMLFCVGNAMHMSPADFKGTAYGFITLFIILFLANVCVQLWGAFSWPAWISLYLFYLYHLMVMVLVFQCCFLFPMLLLASLR